MERQCPVLIWAAVLAMAFLAWFVQDFLGGGDLVGAVLRVGVPFIFRAPELPGNPKLQVGEGSDLRPSRPPGSLSRKAAGSFVIRYADVCFDPLGLQERLS